MLDVCAWCTAGPLLSNYHSNRPESLITCPLDALAQRGARILDNCTCDWHGKPFANPPVGGVSGTIWRGAGPAPTSSKMIDAAAAYARRADVAVVYVGLTNANENEMHDRDYSDNGLGLPNGQEALIRAVHAANPRTVVVLIHGGALAMDWTVQNVPAIV